MTELIDFATWIAFWTLMISIGLLPIVIVLGVLAHIFRGPLERLTHYLVRD